jgi:phage baseplate assembly protein W
MSQFSAPLSGLRQVELLWDDTLQRLAARELGDAARWVDIANLNGLVSPYVTGDALLASDTVAVYGDVLWVPSATSVVSARSSANLVFEQDVMLTNGRLTANGGDFDISFGVPNLMQALRHRVMTAKADLLYHPEYGCDVRRLIGGMNGPVADLLAASYVSAALRRDPRVKDVSAIKATTTGDQLYVDAEVVPIDNRRVQFGGYF